MLFEQYTLWALLWCAFALACGGFIKGALGIGTPLLTVPLMTLVLPPQLAVTVMVVPIVVTNLLQAWRAPKAAQVVATFWPVVVATFACVWVGVSILAYLNERALLLTVGVAVIVFSLIQVSRFSLRIPISMTRPVGVVFGAVSGVIGGISSFFGPMLILYLVSLRTLRKEHFIGAISFLYLGSVLPWTGVLWYFGLLDARVLLLSSVATPPVLAGMAVGTRTRKHISEQRFQHLIAAVLVASGLVIAWRAWHG